VSSGSKRARDRRSARRQAAGRGRSEDGAVIVEFAIVSGLLVVLVIGIISYGYMLSFRQAISQGAAEGARAAAVLPVTSANQGLQNASYQAAAFQAVNQALDSYGITCQTGRLVRNGVQVGTCDAQVDQCDNDASQTCASVALDYWYRDHALVPTFPGLGVALPSHLAYTAVAEVG
jgi:Flp pilus assembly protein TadG